MDCCHAPYGASDVYESVCMQGKGVCGMRGVGGRLFRLPASAGVCALPLVSALPSEVTYDQSRCATTVTAIDGVCVESGTLCSACLPPGLYGVYRVSPIADQQLTGVLD
jgi:hypothetical protein